MKGFKFLMMLIAFAMAATACSKGGGGGGTPAQQDRYYYQGNYCYDRNTGQRISNAYCDDDNYGGGYENQCIGWVIYAHPYYVDAVDCTNPNAYYVECRDPEAYARDGETVTCMETYYGGGYGSSGTRY